MNKSGAFRSGFRVVPCQDENSEITVGVSNATEGLRRNHKRMWRSVSGPQAICSDWKPATQPAKSPPEILGRLLEWIEISGGTCSWLRTRIGRDLIRLGCVKQKDFQRRLCGSHVLHVHLVLIFWAPCFEGKQQVKGQHRGFLLRTPLNQTLPCAT